MFLNMKNKFFFNYYIYLRIRNKDFYWVLVTQLFSKVACTIDNNKKYHNIILCCFSDKKYRRYCVQSRKYAFAIKI